MQTTRHDTAPTIALTHAVFRNVQPVLFRRAEDGLPSMVVSLGTEQAVLPLAALRREFGIAEDSEDGRMLALIEQALDYVAGIKPGEALPPEVLGDAGGALSPGFEPSSEHQRRAALRVQAALGDGAERGEAVSPRAAAIAMGELAAVECLRTTLIERVAAFRERAMALARAHPGASHHALAASQVARLARGADAKLGERFTALDRVNTTTLLRRPNSVLPAMQAGREVLHRNRVAWTPTLDAWERARATGSGDWKLVERTYRFLAPRYMSTTEWCARFVGARAAANCTTQQMIW
jgi:hypothetical protein